MQETVGRARPRIGLLGNPSDIYGGAVLALAFDAFEARVRLGAIGETGARSGAEHGLTLAVGTEDEVHVEDPTDLAPREYAGGARLLAAALARFRAHAGLEASAFAGLELAFESDIPRQAGLAGSSAIVAAALRALYKRFDVALDPFTLSELALAAEVEELGTVAGPQDRVAQAYEGLVHMDFSGPRASERYRRLDPALLPPLLLAWDPQPGQPSGDVHAAVRARWEAGEPLVRETLARFPALVARGVAALEQGDDATLRALVDENFDLRARLFPIGERDRAMVTLGREHAAGTKLAGSGGAVVCAVPDEGALPVLERAFASAGFPTLRPAVAGGAR